ncbi:MAG: LytTR family DNA-binding domain-containing protein [Ferruginibacter sp.]
MKNITGSNSFFNPSEVIRLEAKSNYTKIYFRNNFPLVVSRVLKEFEALLSPVGFIRIHRSHLVNSCYITLVHKKTIIMNNDTAVDISKRKRTAVLAALKTKQYYAA